MKMVSSPSKTKEVILALFIAMYSRFRAPSFIPSSNKMLPPDSLNTGSKNNKLCI